MTSHASRASRTFLLHDAAVTFMSRACSDVPRSVALVSTRGFAKFFARLELAACKTLASMRKQRKQPSRHLQESPRGGASPSEAKPRTTAK